MNPRATTGIPYDRLMDLVHQRFGEGAATGIVPRTQPRPERCDDDRAFADLLSAKAREGVRVYVIYDSFGSLRSDRTMFHGMARSGVRLQEFHPIRPWECRYSWRPANRDHRKMLVVDDEIGGLG